MDITSRIFPPTGEKNLTRFNSVEEKERAYRWFCLEFCDQILTNKPSHMDALDAAANHYTALGYFQDGLALDYRLVALRPRCPWVLYNLSCSLALLERRDEALATLEKAIQYGYDDIQHMASDHDLAPLREDRRFSDLLARNLPASRANKGKHSHGSL